MRKVKFSSSGFSYYIPNSLNVFSVEDPLLQILCDEERNILYTRSQNGAVRVYDLGAKGMDAPRRVVEVNDIAQLAGRGISSGSSYYGNGSRRSMYNGGGNSMFENRSPSYGGSRGGYGSPRYGDYRSPSSSGRYGQGSQTTEAKKKAGKLVHIAIVSTQESASVTLVGVCADGRRVYLTRCRRRRATEVITHRRITVLAMDRRTAVEVDMSLRRVYLWWRRAILPHLAALLRED